jgi:hypothetical protein
MTLALAERQSISCRIVIVQAINLLQSLPSLVSKLLRNPHNLLDRNPSREIATFA